jgi:hypothetical protein
MSDIVVRKTHTINFKPVRVGDREWSVPEPLQITAEQYEGLAECTTALIEINGELFSVSEIRNVEKIPEPLGDCPQRWQYDSWEEYQEALDNYREEKRRRS